MTKINCEICGAQVHSIQIHLRDEHPDTNIAEYREQYPEAPLLSDLAKEQIKKSKKETSKTSMSVAAKVVDFSKEDHTMEPLHKTFGLGKVKAALNGKGDAIPIKVFKDSDYNDLVPEADSRYIFNIELLKTVLLGLEFNIPTYLWGHAGVGKSTIFEQIAHNTNRPYYRVQHTANTEESHIVGQTLANEDGTYFEPGPLALAMKNGWLYNADEYDFAHASILAVYQPVLEGKSLVIKEAPPEWRVVKPHPNFRFVATGNTNGSGDEHALYVGTNIGNAANYSRFGIVEMVDYMPKKQEIAILINQAGLVAKDAEKVIDFAGEIRKAFDKGDMTSTVGPRELINASRIGVKRGSWTTGLKLSFINRLGSVDRETALGIAQRIFG